MKSTFLSLLLFIGICPILAQTIPVDGKFQLMTLPYATNALEPVISQKTVELHHGKHLAAYVANLNRLVAGTAFQNVALEEVVKLSKGSIFNNAGQLLNHNLYFTQFSPNGQSTPTGAMAQAIDKQWGSFESFKKAFEQAAASLFGSGWVWLAKDGDGKLVITQEPNGANPLATGLTPLLGVDLWEHAYYLDYQNRRVDHLKALWQIVDWKVVSSRY